MNIGISANRAICKFNLQGRCKFGHSCWNRHESPHKRVQKLQQDRNESTPNEDEGACALPPKTVNEPLREVFGPSTSSSEEAISLIKIAESEEKVCGICFDTILKKVRKSEQTFGILPNCNHCYCFTCIRKWRKSKEFELDVSKACPECRVASDFVYPSKVWMESKEDKQHFIDGHREKMKKQDCRYFRKGKGKCPFGNTCLYLHALPNGKVLDVGPPSNRRRRSLTMIETEAELLQQLLFWMNEDDYFSDDDDSDFFGDDLDNPIFYYYNSDDELTNVLDCDFW